MPAFPALAHIAVTVSDLEISTRWYTRLFGSDPVLDEDDDAGNFHHTVFLLDGGQLFGIHEHTLTTPGPFGERRPGLDHVSFSCPNREELAKWVGRLDELDIAHGGIVRCALWVWPVFSRPRRNRT